MFKSEENSNPNVMKPSERQGMGVVREFGQVVNRPTTQGHNRRALSVVSENVVGSRGFGCGGNKTGLARKDVDSKNVVYRSSRPVTRKFAAQSEIQQARREECKKLKPTVPASNQSNDFGESIFVDAEESKAPLDHSVAMSLEQSDLEGPNEADQMDEAEMEDIDEEEFVIDIDGSDSKDPLAVVEYVEELYAYYKKMEIHSCVSPDYMVQQFDINEKMRAILIDWLIEVHDKFELMNETLFLTVNIIDRFLAQHSVVRKKLQLVGLVALLLACKYEEVSVPVVGDLIIISDKAYTRQEVLDMERLMLNTLQFNVSLPTPYVFMKRFLKAAQSDKKIQQLSFFLIELSLVEYEMIRYPPSLLSAAAIYTAHCTLYGVRQWTKKCEWHSSYSEDGLIECSKLMVGFHQKAATGKLTGVHRKYCTSKFNYIAEQEPALFLIDTQL